MSSLEPMQHQKKEKKPINIFKIVPCGLYSPYEYVKRLLSQEEKTKRRKKLLMKKIKEELETARKKGTENKKAAIKALKRKKQFERQLPKIDGFLELIEKQKRSITKDTKRTDIYKAELQVMHAISVTNSIWSIYSKIHTIKDWNEEELENELEELLKEKNVSVKQ